VKRSSLLAACIAACVAFSNAWANEALLLQGALEQVGRTKVYDPAYVKIPYPQGDVPLDRGVCSDVVVRAFRKAGIDLQQRVHEDMRRNFSAYPKLWGLSSPDSNIDHRRVPNLMTYLKRQGKEMPVSTKAQDYRAGDIVVWRLPNGLLHIGLLSDRMSSQGSWPLVIHNIGAGAQLEDILFAYQQIGHYRYFALTSP